MKRNGQDDLDKGDWCFLNNDTLISIRWGDDPFKDIVVLPIHKDATENGQPQWKWNGNKELPTLTPSILVHAYPGWTDGWHGYLTDGKLITV